MLNPVDLGRQRWKSLRKALEKQEEMSLRLTEAGAHLAALQEQLPAAKDADRLAYAEAIEAGQDEPPRKADQLAVEIENAQRHVDACVVAVENAAAKIDRLRAENSKGWIKDTIAAIAEAHSEYEDSIRRVAECREALADEVALAGWIRDGLGISPIRDALSGRDTRTRDGREPLSFGRVLNELDEDAMNIATHLREIQPASAWSAMRRIEALVGTGVTREQAAKQVGWE
jgi:hypothetical protein